jgi:hypothetical protein
MLNWLNRPDAFSPNLEDGLIGHVNNWVNLTYDRFDTQHPLWVVLVSVVDDVDNSGEVTLADDVPGEEDGLLSDRRCGLHCLQMAFIFTHTYLESPGLLMSLVQAITLLSHPSRPSSISR